MSLYDICGVINVQKVSAIELSYYCYFDLTQAP